MRTPELIPIDEPGIREMLERCGFHTPLVDLALRQAAHSHAFQLRDNGDPYLDQHIFPVTVDIIDYFLEHQDVEHSEVESTIIAAILHDTLEDDPDFSVEQCRNTYGPDIAESVWRLSKLDEDTVPYVEKLQEGSLRVKRVKIADRINNLLSSVAMLPNRHEKLKKYLAESTAYYIPLAESMPDGVYATRLKCVIGVATVALQDIEVSTSAKTF